MIKDLTLEQVINIAKSSELQNLGVTNKYSDMCNLINLTLVDLHNRFELNKGIITIPLEKDKTIYYVPDYIEEEDN